LRFGSAYDGDGDKMVRNLRTAHDKDRKRFKKGGRVKTLIMATVKGDNSVQVPSLYHNEMLKWINDIRTRFSGIVIRRTVWSTDNTDARISGLAPL
jgi:hypothetical protein